MTDRLLGFTGVCVLLTFVPGVDTAMVTRTALGAASGLFVHAAACRGSARSRRGCCS